MSIRKLHLESLLRRELHKLNELIDAKVVMGLPYAREARQHRIILARLINLRKARRPLISRLGSVSTLFF